MEDKNINICLVHPNLDAETFIKSHIDNLPFKVLELHGGLLPNIKDNGKLLVPLFLKGIDLGLEKYFHLPSSFLQKRAIYKYLKENNISVVLAEYGPTGVAMLDACKSAEIPLIVHFHGYDASHKPTLEEYKTQYQDLFEYASAIITVSNLMTNKLCQLGAPKNKLYCIPCGANTKLFQASDPSLAGPNFVAVGRFVDKKAPHLTILAFNKILETIPDAKLIMVGNGELFDACDSLVKSLKIEQKVIFKGACPQQEIVKIMQSARAFVQHSITPLSGDSEGTPVAVMEASAIGLPVISTRHAGIMDVIIHGETGYLVEEYDINAMSEYMIELAQNPALAKQLGEYGKSRIRENYSIDISIERLANVIRSVS